MDFFSSSYRALIHVKSIGGLAVLALVCLLSAAVAQGGKPISWDRCLRQSGGFYSTEEAVRVADNVLLYQRSSGGWPKNINMAVALDGEEKARLRRGKGNKDSTIDNGSTHTQLRYLAKVYSAAGHDRFRESFNAGVNYLLDAQYDNGGWPQFYPLKSAGSYSNHVTFNDNAMIGVMSLLRDIAEENGDYRFVDGVMRTRARQAVQKGIECILRAQIVVDGMKTAWCAQHDEKTLEPAAARSYEKISISGAESVGIVRFLMGIENPNSHLINSIQSAVAWFDRVRIEGIAVVRKAGDSGKGRDTVVVVDPAAPPVWARFYEIGTNRPIFCGRDGVVKYSLAEIEQERRTGYSWYGSSPRDLLAKDYPAWQKKWVLNMNVLGE